MAGQRIRAATSTRRHHRSPAEGRICDAYGFQLGLATLPGNSNDECHEAAGSELFDIIMEARLPIELQPSHYFTAFVPVARLLAPGNSPGLVFDAAMPNLSLPEVVTLIGQRRGRPTGAQLALSENFVFFGPNFFSKFH